jgi:hypothetical protein
MCGRLRELLVTQPESSASSCPESWASTGIEAEPPYGVKGSPKVLQMLRYEFTSSENDSLRDSGGANQVPVTPTDTVLIAFEPGHY